ncbi:hypothetical protein F3Y22_tig00113548pilonHSYRG00090 [Hibiscus syriacus]|uniref:Chaperone DnaJ C-terminal domain-containing protein n=1 Tax=Hibiscus syriacus TaxID=106335 RepID=A0A6A2WNW5_HIBSY|nr:hypothetical protein F3Y22_tig00113548pilonHSYRG00090 [Hibiscus syriacus]
MISTVKRVKKVQRRHRRHPAVFPSSLLDMDRRRAGSIHGMLMIFAEFFGYSSPFAGGVGGPRGSSSLFGDNIYGSIGGGGSTRGTRFWGSLFGDDIFGSMHQGLPRKVAPAENKLLCSLEELYKGTTKKIKISREIAHISGKTMQTEEILTINVRHGWKKGTKITFAGKGNKQPNFTPVDLVFIIDEKQHNVFTRDGNDLIVTQKVTLVATLYGLTVHLTTLDGRNLTVPINNVIHPYYEEVVSTEGMSIQRDPSKRGNLIIKFDIKFPTRLATEQKSGIKKLLGPWH